MFMSEYDLKHSGSRSFFFLKNAKMYQPKLYLEEIVKYMSFSMCSERSIYDPSPLIIWTVTK